MCRAKNHEQDGRRCPSHTEPQLIDERNEVRREQYAHKKTSKLAASVLEEHNVKFILGKDAGKTYFQGQEFYDPKSFNDVKDHPFYPLPEQDPESDFQYQPPLFSKPQAGGIWTAPGKKDGRTVKTSWTDWAHHEGFRNSETKIVEMKIRPHAVIVTIDNNDDVESLVKAFPNGGGNFSFEKLKAAGVDGIHLSQEGNQNSKMANFGDKINGFSMWDMESTVWISHNNLYQGEALKRGEYTPDDEYDDRDEENPWADDEDTFYEGRKPLNEEEIAVLRAKLMGDNKDTPIVEFTEDIDYDASIAELRSKLMVKSVENPQKATRNTIPSYVPEEYPIPMGETDIEALRRKLIG